MKSSLQERPPSKLLDGDVSSFAHSNEESNGMWIRVNLEYFSIITKVIVFNRQENTPEITQRIVGATVSIKEGDKVVKNCGTFDVAKLAYAFPCIATGDKIEISQEGQVGVWNLAEILIVGYG